MKKLNSLARDNPFIVITACSFLALIVIYMKEILRFISSLIVVMNPILLGLCFAFVLNIPLKFIENKILKNLKVKKTLKRTISIILLISLLILFIIFFISIIVPNIGETLAVINNDIPVYIENLNKFIKHVADALNIEINNIINIPTNITFETITEFIKKINLSGILSSTIKMTSSIIDVFINIGIAFVFAIYTLVFKESLKRYAKLISKAFLNTTAYNKIKSLYLIVTNTFAKFFVGQFTDACILGLLCYLVMAMSGIPYASIICLTISITALIPIFGAFIGTFIGFVLIVFINPMKAILFILEFLVVQQIDNHLIYPNIVGKSIGIKGIFVMSAVIIGGGIAGPLGMLVAVPSMSIIYQITRNIVNDKIKEKKKTITE